MMLSVPRWENPWMVVAFLTFTGCAFGMNLLALQGNDGAHLHDAIDVLEKQQQLAMRFFVMGLFSYFISSIMVTWLFFTAWARCCRR